MAGKIKPIAMFFPQFHAIPENDRWWGRGFTDWENVKSGEPQFSGHYQPRVPANRLYYDQSSKEILRWQIELAKRHGIFGFCHYHYWFDGKQLLETPTNLVLEDPSLDLPFCLSWANETWSRRWDGRDSHILIQQTHPPTEESWRRHYGYLIRAWKDPRAIKVDGKPVFVIYRPQNIEKIDDMLKYWRCLAEKDGLPGLYFIFQKTYDLPNRSQLNGFDALFHFQPFEAVYSPNYNAASIKKSPLFRLVRRLPERYQDFLRSLHAKMVTNLTFHNYDSIWEQIVELRADRSLTTYPGAFVDWDNTARYKRRATVFKGASPARFKFWFSKLLKTMPERQLPENFIFINAWNEWSEGAYLEPDERFGLQYLESIRDACQ
ncbi:MAG TPA: glycoside hydrolase family 99-like domain-containing protein [Nitrosomonas sp.]|jgi:hypothetical protein|nr:glycoside hydrolase family 99-like domain-containing protein [Nitrosomonas sp.]